MTERDQRIFSIIDKHYPEEISFLPVISSFRFLVTVMLSASTTDRQAEKAAENLFSVYPDENAIAAVDADDIRNFTAKQVKRKMREKGHLRLTAEDNIDIIIKEYKNRELDTNDLYTIINDLDDEGVEVISLVLDYIKRIRPVERANDEKTELKNISNELKELAKYFDIPVITAQQLNRSGASVVDAALQAKKEDVTRLVGRDSIAGAWEIIENSDFCCIINPEVKSDTQELFLTFKLLKRRYRSSEARRAYFAGTGDCKAGSHDAQE